MPSLTCPGQEISGEPQYIRMGYAHMGAACLRQASLWGTAEVIEDDPALVAELTDQDYKAVPERVIIFRITAWDVNCPQHIPRKFGEQEIQEILEPYETRITALEAEINALRGRG